MKHYNKLFLLMSFLMIAIISAGAQEQSIQNALNPDGTLRAGATGSYNTQGYTMTYGAKGAPIFVPQTQNAIGGSWDTLFGLPLPGIAGEINAFAADAIGNVYVGGGFGAVGGVSTGVNNIVRYNVQTNSWSVLGSGILNGVSNEVDALVIDGSGKVYVGGFFLRLAV